MLSTYPGDSGLLRILSRYCMKENVTVFALHVNVFYNFWPGLSVVTVGAVSSHYCVWILPMSYYL